MSPSDQAPGGAPLPTPPVNPTRLVYFGTPTMAVPPLAALVDAGFDVALVVTGADKRRGRRAEPTPTPVRIEAMRRGIPVTHDPDDAAGVDADLGVVVAFGRILRRPLLERLPMVNLHFSLLPRWRGAAPVERAIMAGDERTGVCVMAVEEGLDTGAVYARRELTVRRGSTAAALGEQLTVVGASLLVDTLRAGLRDPEPQLGPPVYAEKIRAADLELDWDRSAVDLDRVVRVGGAWTTFRDKRLKVVDARAGDVGSGSPGELHGDVVACGEGGLRLVVVQPEGKAEQPFAAWVNGARPTDGERLGPGAR
ncbi:MAG: methionyl-tRNA formyltransferase [Actinobacteria bacterium]|nr:methionyl-tRNA formyltransferase [Actinomycetota bacterium]